MRTLTYIFLFTFGLSAFAADKLCKGMNIELLIDFKPKQLVVTEVQGNSRNTVVYDFIKSDVRKNGIPVLIYEGIGLENQWHSVRVDSSLTEVQTVGVFHRTNKQGGEASELEILKCADDPATGFSLWTCDEVLSKY